MNITRQQLYSLKTWINSSNLAYQKSPCTGFEKEKDTDKAITTFHTKKDFTPIF